MFSGFSYYWGIEFSPTRKGIKTPLFSLTNSRAAEAFRHGCPIYGFEFGWRVYFWPTNWRFTFTEGAEMYRFCFEWMAYIPTYYR